MKVEMIEEGSLKEQYTIVDDGRNAAEDIEVWKTVEEGIDDWFKLHRRQGKPVENPFVVCSFDC